MPEMRALPETAVFNAVRRWLKGLGFKVYAEVFCLRRIDVVATRPRWVMPLIVEVKTRFTRQLLYQGAICQLLTPHVFVAASTQPSLRTLAKCRQHGLGILHVNTGIEVLLWPENRIKPFAPHVEQLFTCLRSLRQARPGEGGVPTLPGTGPAQAVSKMLWRFFADRPERTWREAYQLVPNHYVNYRSMQNAQRRFNVREA
ncbi:MAG: hypothetical protein MUP47_03715 [Phycisphaerae bacterium]|nr:hypothetical protein [Phycisphaerae bacterium]